MRSVEVETAARMSKFTSVMPFSSIKEERLDFVNRGGFGTCRTKYTRKSQTWEIGPGFTSRTWNHEKFECTATIVEGGPASAHFKIKTTASGGFIVKEVKDDKGKAKESVVKHSKVNPGGMRIVKEVKDDKEKAKESAVKHSKANPGGMRIVKEVKDDKEKAKESAVKHSKPNRERRTAAKSK